MLIPLRAHFSDAGRDQVESHLRSGLREGDLVLDRSGYRVAFVFAPPIVKGRELAGRARLASDPFTFLLPRRGPIANPLEPARVVAVTRYGLLDEFRALYTGRDGDGPYSVDEDRQLGRFRAVRFKARHGGVRPAIGKRSSARFLKVAREMLAARPPAKGALEIDLPVEGAPRWVTVYGGLADGAPQWRRADVIVAVRCGGRPLGALAFPNEPGLRGESLRLPGAGCGMVSLAVSAVSPVRRSFYIDALWVD
jgi:hypothetical protein